MNSILIASLLYSVFPQLSAPKEPVVQAVHCSIYAMIASTHIPSDLLKNEWLYQSTEWSKEAMKIGITVNEHFLASKSGFEAFEEMMEGERLGIASYLYRTEGCSNGRSFD